MRQLLPQSPINISSQHCTKDHYSNGPDSLPEQGKQWARTSAGECPTQSKNSSSKKVTWNTPVLVFQVELAAFVGLYVKTLHQGNTNDAQHDGRADDTVHMETLEAKHFLNTVPGDGFGLGHYKTKKRAEKEVEQNSHNGSQAKDEGKNKPGH